MNSNPKCKWLLLIPTMFEMNMAIPFLTKAYNEDNIVLSLCGFGPVAAAASSAKLIAQHQPENIMLLGIAGSYNDQLEVGNAYQFGKVISYGVGVGTGSNFQSADQLGWKQWSDDSLEIGSKIIIDDREPLSLLTVCAASSDAEDAALKARAYPGAAAEEMEGFGVALASQMAGYERMNIIRGISNRAGDRNKDNWQTTAALKSACRIAMSRLFGDE